MTWSLQRWEQHLHGAMNLKTALIALVLVPVADAFGSAGGLPRGPRGTATRGGETRLAATSGFDLGEWLKQAFNPPTSAAVKKNSR